MHTTHTATAPTPPRPRRPRFDDETVEAISECLRVIADPTRIRLIELLDAHDASVQTLADTLAQATSRQNVAKHIRVLHDAGVLSRKQNGDYSLTDWTGLWVVDQLAHARDDAVEARHAQYG